MRHGLWLLGLILGGCELVIHFDQVPERSAQCGDALDNDDDGLIDCADPGCAGTQACAARCGDGLPAAGAGEECDDGNAVEGDLCDSNCTVPRCGNGIVDPLRPAFSATKISVKSPVAIAAALIDDDATPDVIVASSSGEVTELRGAGGGALVGQPAAVVPRATLTAVAVGALDEGGSTDVVVLDSMLDDLVLVPNGGNGLGTPARRGDLDGDPLAVVLGDFDGDEDLDAFTASAAGPNLLLNTGGGSFTVSSPAVPESPSALAVADVDGDGRSDLVLANAATDHVIVLLANAGTASFPFTAGPPLTVGDAPVAVAAVDLDGANRLDLVTVNAGSNDVTVLLSTAAGTYAAAPAVALPATPTALASADLDGDGDLDLAVGLRGAAVAILLGDRRGGFTLTTIVTVDGDPRALLAAAIDGDALPDLVTAETGADRVTVLLNRPVRETCDDGNSNDSDGCTTACTRP